MFQEGLDLASADLLTPGAELPLHLDVVVGSALESLQQEGDVLGTGQGTTLVPIP